MNNIVLVRATDENDIRFNKFIHAFSESNNVFIYIYSNTKLDREFKKNGNQWFIFKSSNIRVLRIFKNIFIWPLKLMFNKNFKEHIKNSKFIYCGDFESLSLGIYAKLINTNIKLVYDVYDEIYLRYKNFIINIILSSIERWMRNFAEIVITCSKERSDVFYKNIIRKTYVVHNKPLAHDIIKAKNLEMGSEYYFLDNLKKNNNNKIIILVSGWVNDRRGLDKIIYFSKINSNSVIIVMYSQVDYAIGENIICREMIDQVTLFSCLNLFSYQFVLYNPKYKINIYAAPNKIWDGINFGLPSIINKEVICASNIEYKNNFIIVPYNNPELWMDLIKKNTDSLCQPSAKIETFEDDFNKIFF